MGGGAEFVDHLNDLSCMELLLPSLHFSSTPPHLTTQSVSSVIPPLSVFSNLLKCIMGTAVAQWLTCCATNRKVAGSIPAGVIGFFNVIKSFRSHYGPGVDSASNRNEYQDHFLGVKVAGA